MNKYTSTPIKVSGFFLLISIFFSCTKDSDLLADYVMQDSIDVEQLASEQNEQDASQGEEQPPQDPPQDETSAGEDKEMGELKAFPGAEGFGKNATGGRGGIIVEVTNLNDSGPGSLRYALGSIKGPRTVVFRVGGTIHLNSTIRINEGYGDVTIAGQTAPGDGILIAGASFWVHASNIIIRHIRIRPGYAWNSVSGGNADDVFRIVAWSGIVQDIILDHCSLSWGKDENIEIGTIGGTKVQNVTIQNSIISENIQTGYGLLLWEDADRISIYRNLFAHNKNRNIESTTPNSNYEMVNNLIYNYSGGFRPSHENEFDWIGNVYKTKPGESQSYETARLELGTLGTSANYGLTKAYIADNTYKGGPATISSIGDTNLEPWMQGTRVYPLGITPMNSSQVEATILADVGASLSRDAVDTRIINDVVNGTGRYITNESQVGGFPTINGGSPYIDSDGDGMSDEWEITNGLNPNDSSDQNDKINGNDYTNLEAFLHYLTVK